MGESRVLVNLLLPSLDGMDGAFDIIITLRYVVGISVVGSYERVVVRAVLSWRGLVLTAGGNSRFVRRPLCRTYTCASLVALSPT